MPHETSATHQPQDRYYGYASHVLRVIRNHPGRSRAAVELNLRSILHTDDDRGRFREALRYMIADGLLVEQRQGMMCALYLPGQKRPEGERISVAASRVRSYVDPAIKGTWKSTAPATATKQPKLVLPTASNAEKLKRLEQQIGPLIAKRDRLAQQVVSLDEDIQRLKQQIEDFKGVPGL